MYFRLFPKEIAKITHHYLNDESYGQESNSPIPEKVTGYIPKSNSYIQESDSCTPKSNTYSSGSNTNTMITQETSQEITQEITQFHIEAIASQNSNSNANALDLGNLQATKKEQEISSLITEFSSGDQNVSGACNTAVTQETTKPRDRTREMFERDRKSQKEVNRAIAKQAVELVAIELEDEFWQFLSCKSELTEEASDWIVRNCTGRGKPPTPRQKRYAAEFLNLRASKQPKVETQVISDQPTSNSQETPEQRTERLAKERYDYIQARVREQAIARLATVKVG